MIVDSARDRRIFGLLLECFYSSHSSLFATPLPPKLESVAPYLVPLDYDDNKTRKFLSNAWGNNWGMFIRCDTSQDRLRRHLRNFVSVRDPRGQRLLFRYYDPRILRTYLPTCTTQELEYVFGPIECFLSESKVIEDMIEFRFDRGKLAQRTVSLETGLPRAAGPPRPTDEPERIFFDKPFGLLTIRATQMESFAQQEFRKFEDLMVNHLTQFFPVQCKALGITQLRELTQHGIRRDAGYGITTERDICKFINLAIVFGRDFDREERSAWATQILATGKTPGSKIRSLCEAAKLQLGG
jgi:hypothetical protein